MRFARQAVLVLALVALRCGPELRPVVYVKVSGLSSGIQVLRVTPTLDGVAAQDAPTEFRDALDQFSLVVNTKPLFGVWGSGPNDVYAVGAASVVGTESVILHWDGMKWSPQASGDSQGLNGVWGSGPNDVFVVGASGTILRYTP